MTEALQMNAAFTLSYQLKLGAPSATSNGLAIYRLGARASHGEWAVVIYSPCWSGHLLELAIDEYYMYMAVLAFLFPPGDL